MEMYTTSRLLACLEKLSRCSSDIQVAVLSCDQLSNYHIVKKKVVLIVNYDDATKAGSHWCLLYRDNFNKPLEFFCSFGLPFSFYPRFFSEFAIKNSCSVKQISKRLQDINSVVCGDYCLYIAFMRLSRCSMFGIYKCFTTNYKYNDRMVRKFVNLYFKKITNICSRITDQKCVCFNVFNKK